MEATIAHQTITTGNLETISRSDEPQEVVKLIRNAILYSLSEDEPVALFPDFDPKAKFLFQEWPGGGLKCSVYYGQDEPALVFIVVRRNDEESRREYRELIKRDVVKAVKPSDMPPVPFCAVAITEDSLANMSLMSWISQLEKIVSIAWVFGEGQDGKTVEQLKSELWEWLMFGVEEFAPTKETINALGKIYLENFLTHAEQNVNATGMASLPVARTMLERIKKLRGMTNE